MITIIKRFFESNKKMVQSCIIMKFSLPALIENLQLKLYVQLYLTPRSFGINAKIMMMWPWPWSCAKYVSLVLFLSKFMNQINLRKSIVFHPIFIVIYHRIIHTCTVTMYTDTFSETKKLSIWILYTGFSPCVNFALLQLQMFPPPPCFEMPRCSCVLKQRYYLQHRNYAQS